MTLQPNLESVLFKVNNFINIDAHRQYYTDHFSHLKNIIFEFLRKNEAFAYMFNGLQLGGSYGDNVKVSVPNEFDLVFHITFPEQTLINVIKDDDLPGNVFLDFSKVLKKIANEKQHENNLKHLKKWLDEKNFLKVEVFQLFIQSCFVNVLSLMQKQITFKNKKFFLCYDRQGPAHTISVNDGLDFKYSVDFVPGILLSDKQSVIPNLEGNWEAIPKPSRTNNHKNTSFRTSYYRQEHKIIENKQQLKNAYRMIKKFRDNKSNMNKMKSYYIKTLFLHKTSRENSDYWKKPLSEIIIDMFEDLEKSLTEAYLPFYWNKNLNLYENYLSNPRLIREMLNCVESSRQTLQKAAIQLTIPLQNRVYRIFLNTNERNVLERQNNICSSINGVTKAITILNQKTNASEDTNVTTEVSNKEPTDSNKLRCILC